MKKSLNFVLFAFVFAFIFAIGAYLTAPYWLPWTLKTYFHQQGIELSFTEAKWTGNTVTFHDVLLENFHNSYQVSLSAPEVDVAFSFEPSLKIKLALEKPFLTLAKSEAPLKGALGETNSTASFGFFSPEVSVSLHEGVLVLDESAPKVWRRDLNGEISFKNGRISGTVDVTSKEGGLLQLIVAKEDENFKTTLRSSKFLIVELSKIAEFFSQPFDFKMDVKSGFITGILTILESPNSALITSGRMVVEDFSFLYNQVQTEIPKVRLNIEPLAYVHIEKEASFWKKILSNTYLEAQIILPANIARFRENEPYWMARNLTGKVSLNGAHDLGLTGAFKGQFFFQEELATDLQLQFSYPFKEDKAITLHASIGQEGADKAFVQALMDPQKTELNLINVGSRELEIARDFLTERAPLWKEAQVDGGFLNAHIIIKDKGALEQQILIESISAKNLAFKVPVVSLEGKVASLKGKGEIILHRRNKSLWIENAVVSLQDGDFYWDKKKEPSNILKKLSHINGAFLIQEGKIKEATLQGSLADIEGSLVVYTGSDKALDFKAKGPLKQLHDLMGNHSMLASLGSLKGDSFAVKGSVLKVDMGLNILSELVLKSPEGIESNLSIQLYLKRLLSSSLIEGATLWERWGVSLQSSNDLQAAFSKVVHFNWLKDDLGSYYLSLYKASLSLDKLQLGRYLSSRAIERGVISAIIGLEPLRKNSVWDMGLSVEEMHVTDLSYKKEHFSIYIPDSQGNFTAHISEQKNLLYIDKASFKSRGASFQYPELPLNKIDAQIEVSQGLVDLFQLEANLGELNADFNFYGLKSPATFSIKGNSEALLKFLDPTIPFMGEISYIGKLIPTVKGLKLESFLTSAQQVLTIKADLPRVPLEKAYKEVPLWSLLGNSFYELPGATHKLFSYAFKFPFLKDKEGTYLVRLGTLFLDSSAFHIKKPLSIFLKKYLDVDIEGIIHTKVKITDAIWQAGFSLKKASFKNDQGTFFAEEIGGYNQDTKIWTGLYYYTKEKGALIQAGFKGATYHNMPLNLDFIEGQGQIKLKGKVLELVDIKAISQELSIEGHVLIDYTEAQSYALEIKSSAIQGTISNAQKFGLQFTDLDFLHYPSMGRIQSGPGGFFLRGQVPYSNEKADIQWALKASLKEGMLKDKHLTLHNINTLFSYESVNERLQFDLKEGDLQVFEDHYIITDLVFDTSWKGGVSGSLGLKASLPGESLLYSEIKGTISTAKGQYTLSLAPDCYFGGLCLMADQIMLNSEGTLISCKGQAAWQMNNFFDDSARLLQIFGQKNDFRSFKESTRLSGAIRIDADYTLEKASVQINGKSFKIKGKEVDPLALHITMDKGQWALDKGLYRDLSLKAAARVAEGRIIIENIVGTGPGLNFEGNGQFIFVNKMLELSLKQMMIDLSSIDYAKKWQLLTSIWQPQGRINIVGTLEASFMPENTQMIWKASAITEGIILRGNQLQTEGPLSLHYDKKKGLRVDDVKLTMKRLGGYPYQASFGIKGARYEEDSSSLTINDIAFAFPTNYISEIILLGEQLFPTIFDETTRTLLHDVRREGGLKGNIELDLASEQLRIKIRLSNGTYQYAGRSFVLQDVILDYGEKGFELGARYRIQKALMDMRLVSLDSKAGTGQVLLSLAGEPQSMNNLVVCEWAYKKEKGIILQKVQGVLLGMQIALNGAANLEIQNLAGSIRMMDSTQLQLLLPEGIKSFLQKWQITSGYMIKGQWSLNKGSLEDFQFKGQLLGQQCTLLGNTLQQANGDLKMDFRTIQLQQFRITDPGMTLEIPSLTLTYQENWDIKMGLLNITNLRPADLKRETPINKSLRSLLIKRAFIQNLQGDLSNLNKLTGGGEITFDKVKSSSIGSQLMSIPGEILGRLGLNLSLLSPSFGTIEFKIKDSKVILTKMRDVYSDGKMSRFYLPKEPIISYINFDGVMNITLRMKQYNLLLKLAEGLSINIQGKWDDPEFSLQKSA